MSDWLTQHASPRWLASKVFIETIPSARRQEYIEELALTYPTWFFELFTEIDGSRTELEDFQIRYLLDTNMFKITNKTRQAGGSLVVAMSKFFRAYRNTGYRCDIVSINLKEATDKIRLVRNLWESLPRRWRSPLSVDNALSIGFHRGRRQSIINSLAASPSVRGGKKEMVFDEFAHVPQADDLFYAAAPAIINGDLNLDIISTPMGDRNLFAKIFNNAEDLETGERPFDIFSRHQFIWPDVRRFVTDYDRCQHVWKNEYHEEVSMMRELVHEFASPKLKFFYHMYPWNQFLQEFCGVFVDESTAFFPWSLIQSCAKGSVGEADDAEGNVYQEDFLLPWYGRPETNDNQVFMGVDFGESDEQTDKTSIQVLELDNTGRMYHRYSEVLTKDQFPDFPSQAEHIADVARRMRPQKLLCDGTGLGRGVVPLIQRHLPNLSVEGINFNPVTKEEMVMNLKTKMEQGDLWLMAEDAALLGQIRNIQRDLSPTGVARYHGKPHDDMFWALALAAKGGAFSPFTIYSIGGSRRFGGML